QEFKTSPGHLGSASSNSSCGSTECLGEAMPQPPGFPKADPGHWWASLFFGKSTLLFMAMVLESVEHPEPPRPPEAAQWLVQHSPILDPRPDLSSHHQPQACGDARPPESLPP
uniref:Pancreatic progenitor cell differentiation and proliferation factor n=1 Tax=Theropithecus gelada TaxID=9565 RepID=A0A8D2FWU7_THEGE